MQGGDTQDPRRGKMAEPVRLRVADGSSRAHAHHDQKGAADLVLRMARENENWAAKGFTAN